MASSIATTLPLPGTLVKTPDKVITIKDGHVYELAQTNNAVITKPKRGRPKKV